MHQPWCSEDLQESCFSLVFWYYKSLALTCKVKCCIQTAVCLHPYWLWMSWRTWASSCCLLGAGNATTVHQFPGCDLCLSSSYILRPKQLLILKSFPKQGNRWAGLGKSRAWRCSRICLLGSIAHEGLVLHCWHRTSSLHPSVLHATQCATLCFKHFCNSTFHLCQACRASTLLHCPFMMMARVLHTLFPQVYAALSIPIPGALCTSCHDCSLLFEFILSLSCQKLLLSPLQTYVHFSLPHSRVPSVLPSEEVCVTSYQTALFFIFLSFSWRKDSTGCMPDCSGKMGKMRGWLCWGGTY